MTGAVIFKKGPASWGAYVPGVISVGDSRDEGSDLYRKRLSFIWKACRRRALPYLHLAASPGRRNESHVSGLYVTSKWSARG
jgi:hypothetical protein